MWDVELINDFHCLYSRIHKTFISSQDFKPKASAFSNTPKEGDNLSADWCKYCSPQTSRNLISLQKNIKGEYKNSDLFFIWRFKVYDLKNKVVPVQDVKHDPLYTIEELSSNNRAHSIIIGEKPVNNAEFRVSILKNGEWAIDPKSSPN